MGWQLVLGPLVFVLDLVELLFVARDLLIEVCQDLLLLTFLVQLVRHILLNPRDIYRLELEDLMFHFSYLVLRRLTPLNICLVPRALDMLHEVEARIAFCAIVQAQIGNCEVDGRIALL